MKSKLLPSAAVLLLNLGLVLSPLTLPAAPAIQIDFDSGYVGGENFTAGSTNTNNGLLDSNPLHMSGVSNYDTGGTSIANWTASVDTYGSLANTSLQLHISVEDSSSYLGSMEFGYHGAIAGGDTGTWSLSFDYTNLSPYTNFVTIFNPWYLNGSGGSTGNYSGMQSTLIFGYDGDHNVAFNQYQQYNIRYEADLGTNTTDNVRIYVDNVLTDMHDFNLVGKTVEGATMYFQNSGPVSNGLNFMIDNFTIAAVVPEPSTWALLGFGTAFLFIVRRKKTALPLNPDSRHSGSGF